MIRADTGFLRLYENRFFNRLRLFLPVIFMQNIAQNRRVTIMGYKPRVEDMVVSS